MTLLDAGEEGHEPSMFDRKLAERSIHACESCNGRWFESGLEALLLFPTRKLPPLCQPYFLA